MDPNGIRKAARLIKESEHAVALTGAGVSVPSGIPDFRSPGSGVWNNVDPMEVASISSFNRNPARFYEFLMPTLTVKFVDAEPNAAHYALAGLEEMGYLKTVITQNIDNLHQRAGSREVIELHGNGANAHCVRCNKGYARERFLNRYRDAADHVPRCEECSGVLKPDVVLFGEMLPVDAIQEAYEHVQQCDLILIAGSSLVVTPAATLPQLAMARGASAIIVNLQETYLDRVAEVVLYHDVEKALPEIVQAIKDME